MYLITTRCYLQIIGQLQLSHNKIIGIYSGVWKYGNALLSRASYLKKSYLSVQNHTCPVSF